MKDIRSALILILGGLVHISEVVLQKQFHKVVQSEKVFLVLTLGRVSSFFNGVMCISASELLSLSYIYSVINLTIHTITCK